MEAKIDRARMGPYRLVQPLGRCAVAERWMVLHDRTDVTHLAYRFDLSRERGGQRRFVAAVEGLAGLRHPHLLPIEQFGIDQGGAWVVAPFTGNLDGLVTLESLLEQKGGRMTPVEVERATAHLLEAVEFAHGSGHVHGPIELDEVLVDRRGSVLIELYGLRRRMRGLLDRSGPDASSDEVRSVASLAYRLLTGLPADEPRIAAGRLVPRLDRRWDEWLERGLDPAGGFASAGEAAGALPASRRDVEVVTRGGAVRGVIDRVWRVLGVRG